MLVLPLKTKGPARLTKYSALILLLAAPLLDAAQAQDYGARLGTVQRGGRVSYEPQGPGVLFDALDPSIRKWYVPQELYTEFRWKQWEYSNYARENYQRYVPTAREGSYFYDAYGNFLTRGWPIYDWRQENPQPFGSAVQKTGWFGSFFNNLVVASDHKGEYHYAITVGNRIRTTLTPMTFSKPNFNGLQIDYASDKYQATLLMSRISQPDVISNVFGTQLEQRTNATNLFGGRVQVQVGDFVKVGGTLVNAHHSQTLRQAVNGDIFKGQLTEALNFTPVTMIELRIRDDSPEDGKGGGALFASDLLVYDLAGNETRASEIGFRPLIEGGLQRHGFLAADGLEEILLRYDLADAGYIGVDPTEITRIAVELVVANDYLIEVASDNQVNADDNIVFLPVARARGNVHDGSNQRVLAFDYGLPTANQIAGFTFELTDLGGFAGYAEIDINSRYRQFPNPNRKRHHATGDEALAWLANLSSTPYPFFFFAEAFSVDPTYQTSMITAEKEGTLDYGNNFALYEFVDDNDDQDRRPDWRRKGWGPGDPDVFPGWDENNDFISDFNQNDNEFRPDFIPDYEEPFLRFYSDRPEFLYGIDMNHNGTIDRFENDEEADLPYRRDREGYNVFVGAHLLPGARLMLGRTDMHRLAAVERSEALYGVLTFDRDFNRWGRVRLFQDLRKVRDNIADPVLQWTQRPNTRGALYGVEDPLAARNTVLNTSWFGWEQRPFAGLRLEHKAKWQFYRQLDDRIELELRGLRETASFLGVINKAEYRLSAGGYTLMPRWKSEFSRRRPVLAGTPARLELDELLMLVFRFPLLRRSTVAVGVEYEIFSQLQNPTPPGAEDSFRGLTTTAQLINFSDYLGYRLTTTLGFELTRTNFEARRSELTTRSFITIYSGVER